MVKCYPFPMHGLNAMAPTEGRTEYPNLIHILKVEIKMHQYTLERENMRI